ncbi:hypothetical protein KR222_011533, partial [Zaprionus bogoriensis]
TCNIMDLYYSPASAGSRAIQMTGKALGLEFNLKTLNLFEKEQLKPEFIKINPQHTIPTLVDNGFAVWESRAILVYLVEKYAKDDSLYPKDPQGRALVNQRLYFDMGTLYQAFAEYSTPLFMKKVTDPEKLKKLETALEFLNTFLESKTYVAGDRLTIADLSLLATVTSLSTINVDVSSYSNILRWIENGKKVAPGWEINEKGVAELKAIIESLK